MGDAMYQSCRETCDLSTASTPMLILVHCNTSHTSLLVILVILVTLVILVFLFACQKCLDSQPDVKASYVKVDTVIQTQKSRVASHAGP